MDATRFNLDIIDMSTEKGNVHSSTSFSLRFADPSPDDSQKLIGIQAIGTNEKIIHPLLIQQCRSILGIGTASADDLQIDERLIWLLPLIKPTILETECLGGTLKQLWT